jgi:hypothetical protein
LKREIIGSVNNLLIDLYCVLENKARETKNMLNIKALIDDAKCFQEVRKLRWPDGIYGMLPP